MPPDLLPLAEITSENPYDEADAVRALYRRVWEKQP